MPSPDVLDFNALLAPIAEGSPTGAELRGGDPELANLFYEISDARKEARNSERQKSVYEMTQGTPTPAPAPKPADWQKVVDLGNQIIATKSKDLWVAAWMIEALCRTHEFAGLRDGFRLVRELSEKYWDNIHPRSESDGQDATAIVAQLSGVLDGVLTTPIYEIPITGSCPRRDGDATPRYSLSQHRQWSQLDKQTKPNERREKIERTGLTLEQFTRTVAATPAEAFRCRLEDIDGCLKEFNGMSTELDQKCGQNAAPPTTKTREALADCRTKFMSIAKDKLAMPEPSGGPTDASDGGSPDGNDTMSNHINSREQALQTLLRVADYFRQHEPHSVVSYSLEQVVRWGRMSLPDLLTELISDKKVRQDIFRQAGLAATPAAKSDDSQSE